VPLPRKSDGRLAGLYATYFAAAGVVGTFLPLYLDWRGLTGAQIGIVVSAMQALRVLGPNLWAHVAEGREGRQAVRGRRAAVLRWTALAALFAFLPIFGHGGFWLVLAACCGFALFQTAQMPVADGIVSASLVGNPHAARIYGRVRAWGSIGFVVLVLAGGELFDHAGIAWQPHLAAAMLFATTLMAWRVREPAALPAPPHAALPVRDRLRQPAVRWFFASCALMVAAHGALYAYLSLYLRQLGYSTVAIGAFWIVGVLAEILMFRVQGALFRRAAALWVICACCAVAVARFALLGLWAGIWPLLLVAQLLHAATFAAHHSSAILTIQRWFPGATAARGQGLYTSIAYGAGATAGSLTATWFWSHAGPGAAFLAMSGIALFALLAGWRTLKLDGAAGG
jgi:PPP family 3-phenylpropionic acid transporter